MSILPTVYQWVALFLIVNIVVGMIRILRGPTTADRLLAVQLFGTTGTAFLILFALQTNNDAFNDLALIFALLAGILGVAFTRYASKEERVASQELEEKSV